MGEQEKELLDKIRAGADHVDVPEGLEPENIRKKLTPKKQRKWRSVYYYGAACACCLVLVGILSVYGMKKPGSSESSADHAGEISSQAQAKTAPEDQEDTSKGAIPAAGDYNQIYKYLKNASESAGAYGRVVYEEAASMESKSDEAAVQNTDSQAAAGTEADSGYSDTNVRQEGVDEGDIVKTDGKYLYVLRESRSRISIIEQKDGKMNVVSEIAVEADGDDQITAEEFYVKDQKLIVISNAMREQKDGRVTSYTQADTYDVSEADQAKHLGTVTADGNYSSSRLVDGYVYLFSTFYPRTDCSEDDAQGYVPAVNGGLIEPRDIYMPAWPSGNMYTLAAAFSVAEPGSVTDSKAVFSQGGLSYVSNGNIYLCDTNYSSPEDGEQTQIRKIAYKDGKLTPKAQNVIQGTIKDSFCIDEYKGYVRIAATVNKVITDEGLFSGGNAAAKRVTSNTLYVLNEKLEEAGKISDLAKNESVKSARFFGNTGYFVTFREIDPLFSVDLTDPKNPKIIGELKIPGFSQYLHFFGDGQLLGIGEEVNALTGEREGIKLSMFDISDPSNVKEENKYIIPDSNYSEALSDYKTVLIDSDKNLIGLSVHTGKYSSTLQYMIFSYDSEKGFISNMELELGNTQMSPRGLYIGDILYVVNGNTIQSFQMKDYKKIDDIVF